MDPTKLAAKLLAAARKLSEDEKPRGPKMTPQLQQLVADAKAAGYTVARRGGVLSIVKRQGKITRGLRIYEDGQGVSMGEQRKLRYYRDMRSCLGLNT